MNALSSFAARGRSRLRAMLLVVVLLALASVACSIGGSLAGRSSPGATPTKLPRATFTPLPGALGTPLTASVIIRGTLPPGVTVEAPGGAGEPGLSSGGASGAVAVVGENNLLIYATETPTASPTPTDRPATLTPVKSATSEAPAAAATPYVVIQPATLNGRRGPGTAYERIGQARKGQQLFILGRTAAGDWLQVCCLANQPVWVAADQVETKGAVESAPVMTPAPVPPTARPTPRPVAAAPRTGQSPLATPRPAGTPLPPFDIARGPEFPIRRDNGLLTIWVKVYEGPADNQNPLGGYILKVSRDGVDISDNLQSFGDRAFDNTLAKQGGYDYNLKFEKYDAGEADWEIYLARPGGFRVSPVTKFTTKGDSYRNLVVFIAYLLAR